jgi:hypothetical protein
MPAFLLHHATICTLSKATAAGRFAFVAVTEELDVRNGARDDAACAEFSREGFNDATPAAGRGWAAMGTAGRLVGHIFIHNGDGSGFVAEPD